MDIEESKSVFETETISLDSQSEFMKLKKKTQQEN